MLFRSMLRALIIIAFFCTSVFAASYPRVLIQTNFGDITVELYNDKAPVTVENFLQYVRIGFYDATLFHRVIYDFMIQGGGYYIQGGYLDLERTNDPIINESYNNLSNLRGTIAMARSNDPNSATSQFFINQVDNTFLDKKNATDGFGYCVFGHVISGMDVVDTIAQLPTADIGYGFTDFPYPNIVVINSAKILTPSYWLQADINNDGAANLTDFANFATNWKKTGSNLLGDLNQNNVVDMKDLGAFSQGWLDTMDWYKPVAADMDDNHIVNFADFAILSYQWGLSSRRLTADLNNDWTVDQMDLFLLAEHWLETTP